MRATRPPPSGEGRRRKRFTDTSNSSTPVRTRRVWEAAAVGAGLQDLVCGRGSGAGTSGTRCRGTALASTASSCAREAFARWPVHGNVLEALRDGRLEVGEGTPVRAGRAGSRSGRGARQDRLRARFLNIGAMVAAVELVEIGDHCMFANGCFVTDGEPPLRRPRPAGALAGVHQQGPTRIGDNVWCGANVVVTSGVTIGERCVIGANSVVTRDLPPHSIAAGAPREGAPAGRVRRRPVRLLSGLRAGATIRWNGRSPRASRSGSSVLHDDAVDVRRQLSGWRCQAAAGRVAAHVVRSRRSCAQPRTSRSKIAW